MKDLLGVACSGLCLVHCILVPLILLAGGSSAFFVMLSGEWFHQLIVLPVLVLAVMSFPSGRRHHGQNLPGIFGVVGVLLLVTSLVAGEALETYLTLLASCLLIVAHLYNRRLIRNLTVLPVPAS